jgi:hypothetical protein
MAKVPAFHSVRPNDPQVYHDNDACTEGNNIEASNRRPGPANRPRCQHCTRLG